MPEFHSLEKPFPLKHSETYKKVLIRNLTFPFGTKFLYILLTVKRRLEIPNRVFTRSCLEPITALIYGLEFHTRQVVRPYCSIEPTLVIGRIKPCAFSAPVNVLFFQKFTPFESISAHVRGLVSLAARLSHYLRSRGFIVIWT